MSPAINKLIPGANNQFLFKFASFNRRFVENVQRPVKIHKKRMANVLLIENMALVIINKK